MLNNNFANIGAKGESVPFKTSIENFWYGSGGDSYIDRNDKVSYYISNLSLFSRVFQHVQPIKSVIEFGPNVGYCLKALETLLPGIELSAVEINKNACDELNKRFNNIKVYNQSFIDFNEDIACDLVLIKTVLMFIEEQFLPDVYQKLYNASKRYIFICEYYNPTPTYIDYRGSKIFKRDFAGELLDKFHDLQLIDYGFVYHRDNHFMQDDINWFLLEKK